jgi:hypothetical protein
MATPKVSFDLLHKRAPKLVPDSAYIALARLILKRANLSLPANNLVEAMRIIRGVRPAIPKGTPLAAVIKSKTHVPLHADSVCGSCGKPVAYGSLCRTLWTMNDGEHIQCDGGRS